MRHAPPTLMSGREASTHNFRFNTLQIHLSSVWATLGQQVDSQRQLTGHGQRRGLELCLLVTPAAAPPRPPPEASRWHSSGTLGPALRTQDTRAGRSARGAITRRLADRNQEE